MARKMNIPIENESQTLIGTQRLSKPTLNTESLISEFQSIQTEISNELGYQGLSSSEIYDRLKKDKRFVEDKGVFDVMLKILGDYGTCMQRCDNIIEKVDENANAEFYMEVTNFTLRVEKERISLIQNFVQLDKKKRFEYMNVTPESIRVEEIEEMIRNIGQSESLTQKHKQMLIESFKELILKLNNEYENMKESTAGSIIGSIIGVLIGIYVIYKIVTYFLWDWVGYLIWIGYFYTAMQRYKQLSSVAQLHGKSGGLKMFLYALGHFNND